MFANFAALVHNWHKENQPMAKGMDKKKETKKKPKQGDKKKG